MVNESITLEGALKSYTEMKERVDELVLDTGIKVDNWIRTRVFSQGPHSLWNPSRITGYSYLGTMGGLAMISTDTYSEVGFGVMVAGLLLDKVDGLVAKIYNLRSEEGAIADQFLDKIKFYTLGIAGYAFATNELLSKSDVTTTEVGALAALGVVMASNFDLSIQSMLSGKRGGFLEQAKTTYNAIIHSENCTYEKEKDNGKDANDYGKYKAVVEAFAVSFLVGREGGMVEEFTSWFEYAVENTREVYKFFNDISSPEYVGAALTLSAVLAVKSINGRNTCPPDNIRNPREVTDYLLKILH